MNSLTKVLVVLLSLFSIFLCGTIVIYIGNANNYKEMYDNERGTNQAIRDSEANLRTLFNEKTSEMKREVDSLNERIREMGDEFSANKVKLRSSERLNRDYESRISNWAGVLEGLQTTIANMTMSQRLTQDELDMSRTDLVQLQKELNEITASFYERVVQMQQLEADKRRLLEKLTFVEQKQTQPVVSGRTVTMTRYAARPTLGVPTSLVINGLISDVGQSLVTLSVGSADGVTKGMTFYVTRGDNFICDVVITNVETDKSVGVLELVEAQPRIGDNVSTKL
ncbi:MAG TPA: hypothetical protein ENH94_08925 [Phycisphaerales bacterium]|nr:hypothetical protein [Phycisphaerales bacterium]